MDVIGAKALVGVSIFGMGVIIAVGMRRRMAGGKEEKRNSRKDGY